MRRGPGGHFETISEVGERVSAFVPYPLPPDPAVQLDGARQRLLERAQLACGRLDGIGTLLPDPDLFIYSYVRREAVLSSQIEGTEPSLSDLLLFELDDVPGVPFDDVVEVSNYVAGLWHGLGRLRDGIGELGRRAGDALRVFDALRARPVATIRDLASRAGLTYPTANKLVEKLEELGIVQELTGRSRDRVFAYKQYVQILSEGTEPL